jgi:hypothetical protein
LDRLIDDIAKQIAEDPSMMDALAVRPKGKKCPSGTACCVRKYGCIDTAFACKPDFIWYSHFVYVDTTAKLARQM